MELAPCDKLVGVSRYQFHWIGMGGFLMIFWNIFWIVLDDFGMTDFYFALCKTWGPDEPRSSNFGFSCQGSGEEKIQ